MRIAQVAPLWERVPPPAYGGTELVVGLLTDELVRRGHEVTLFASGDSITLASLESVHPRSIRLDPTVKEYGIYAMLQLSQVYERAAEFAKRSGWRLKMAGKVDVADREYFEREIKPQIDGKQIEYLGEANHAQKNALMGGGVATLFPITSREPFGLVMIESMASGTPVIAMNMGSTPEVIAHRKTGFLCNSVEECIAAIDKAAELNRRDCREHVVNNFSVQRMADGYEAVYNKILVERFSQNGSFRSMRLSAG